MTTSHNCGWYVSFPIRHIFVVTIHRQPGAQSGRSRPPRSNHTYKILYSMLGMHIRDAGETSGSGPLMDSKPSAHQDTWDKRHSSSHMQGSHSCSCNYEHGKIKQEKFCILKHSLGLAFLVSVLPVSGFWICWESSGMSCLCMVWTFLIYILVPRLSYNS